MLPRLLEGEVEAALGCVVFEVVGYGLLRRGWKIEIASHGLRGLALGQSVVFQFHLHGSTVLIGRRGTGRRRVGRLADGYRDADIRVDTFVAIGTVAIGIVLIGTALISHADRGVHVDV